MEKIIVLGIVLVIVGMIGPSRTQQEFRSNEPPMFVAGGDLRGFSIAENTPVGTVVYRLKGRDPENGDLAYSISGEYFRVNKKTGDVTLVKGIDREITPMIDVIISLTDDGLGIEEPATVSLRRVIKIKDDNDNKPLFHRRPYSFKVMENVKVGSTVFSEIPITDADVGENAEVTLTCSESESPVACTYFEVSAERVGQGSYIGIISLARPLDYETYSSYALTIVASDGVNTVDALVAIQVLDIQDQAPKFYGGPYVFKAMENSPSGTKVGQISVQDGDTGNPRDLQIRLIDEVDNQYFRLANIERDMYTGTYTADVETTDNILDAENEFIRVNLGVYELVLEARELPVGEEDHEPTLIVKTGMAIMIIDDDDNLPSFLPPQISRILRVPFNDEDRWPFPDFRVEVEDADVDTHNSKFELKFNWNLEEEETGLKVNDIFSFITPSNENPIIQSLGIVTMEAKNMTLLEPGTMIDLQIGAYQNGRLISSLNIPIEMAGGPKVPPYFSKTVFRKTVPEDLPSGAEIARVAVDNFDYLRYVKYSLVGVDSGSFLIDEDTGVIHCEDLCLDYERNPTHFFLIKAKSGDTVDDEAFALLYLDVLDVNDNPPKFIIPPGSSVDGGYIKRSVQDGAEKFDPPFYMEAHDPDLEDKVSYTLVDVTQADSGIHIDSNTGEILLDKPLSWEEAGEHKLLVTAVDSTNQTTQREVLIVVQAVENLPPSFPEKVIQVEVPEILTIGEPITTVKAHDPDGQDVLLKYRIDYQPTPDLFLIEEETGVLRLNGHLDFERKPRAYKLKIVTTDSGNIPESGEMFLEILVRDVNDEDPKFIDTMEGTYVVEMSESSKADVIVTTLKAEDMDDSAQLEYSISCPCQSWEASGSMGSFEDAERQFAKLKVADPSTGDILLKDSLNHKNAAILTFNAWVKDINGINLQNDSAIVTLYVTAAEKNKPIFGHPWTTGNPWINVTIPEDFEIGTVVANLHAFDYRAGKEVNKFELTSTDSEKFELIGSELRVVEPLDFEYEDKYYLAVKAVNEEGGFSTANIGITVQDVNDHAPVFTMQEYKAEIPENSEYPTPIITIEASDGDGSAKFGSIRYNLSGPQSHLFVIDEVTGEVNVAPGAMIDREVDELHRIIVTASDTPSNGPFQRRTSVPLTIKVLDENDNDPECKMEEFLVPENSEIGSLVGALSCKDADEEAELIYRLRSDDPDSLFTIDSKSGQLSVAQPLGGRGRSNPYLYSIIVEDGKERATSLTVPVKISNVIPNDGKPYFINENFTVTTLEGAPRGTRVFQAKGFDTDSYDNGEGRLHFNIMKQLYPCKRKISTMFGSSSSVEVEDVEYFTINSESGMVTLAESIDREKHDCFSILVSVEDSGVPAQMETAWFEVTVIDVDDSLPYLEPNDRKLDLKLNSTLPKGSKVYTFQGKDKDLEPNNHILFEISGGGRDLFHIQKEGPSNASLILNADLNEMKHNNIKLTIRCHPMQKKIPVPDCVSNINMEIVGEGEYSQAKTSLLSQGEEDSIRAEEMILGVAAATPVGQLIGNANMKRPVNKIAYSNPKFIDTRPKYQSKIKTTVQMFHPNSLSGSPYNVSELIHIDDETGDIFVWDSLKKYANGHLRMKMIMDDESSQDSSEINYKVNGATKGLKIFILPNRELLSADMFEYSKLDLWKESVNTFLNTDQETGKPKRGHFNVLIFDQSSSIDGKTKICFQFLENENMMSQDKALMLLENGDLHDIFLKYSFEGIQKGCPERIRNPARLTLKPVVGRFWVERSLLGIASVVAIATISAILILCLVNRNRGNTKK